jgi:hypothetical protein
MPASSKNLVLLIVSREPESIYSGDRYAHIYGYVRVWRGPDEYPDTLWAYDDLHYGLSLEGIELSCQMGGVSDCHEGSYAWKLRWASGNDGVTAHNVKRVAKALTGIEKRRDKIIEAQGRPSDFAAFVGQAAQAMKIKTIVIAQEDLAPNERRSGWITWELGSGIGIIRETEKRLVRLCNSEAEARAIA